MDNPIDEEEIQVTDNFVQFFELLLKVDKRLQEQKRKEMLS
ncbi:MAG: hypothetical protein Q7R51_03320 [bacterium]|nr:hypothetical protein [bacterium]